MRLVVLLAVAASLAVAAVLALSARAGSAAKPEPSSATRAVTEISALQRAETSYYRLRGRYSGRLADLFAATRSGTAIVMNSPGLDIYLDLSSDGQTVIVRVNSPTIALSRVLQKGAKVGQTCEVLGEGARCPS